MPNEGTGTEIVEVRKIESGVTGVSDAERVKDIVATEIADEVADASKPELIEAIRAELDSVSEAEKPGPGKKTRKPRKTRKSLKTATPAKAGKAKAETRETLSAFDLSARVRENAKTRGVGAKPIPRADSEKERPYRSPERNNTFRVAFALSLSDREAKTKRVREIFPISAELREKLKKAKIDVGKGYTTKSLSSALSALKLAGFPGFSGFSPKSTRFSVSLSDSGNRVLRFPGFNNSGDVPE